MSRQLIGLTGPSAFTAECIDMVEEYYEADFVMLYQNNEKNLLRWVDRCDGIVIAGGVDIHPTIYNNSIWNNQGFSKFDLKRDQREIVVIDHCTHTGKPLFGICRGHQLIGVTIGFFLIPDLSTSSICHQPQRQQITLERHEPMHSVQIINPEEFYNIFPGRDPNERTAYQRVMGFDQNTKLWTNSFHHQGLAYPTKGGWPNGAEKIQVYGTARVDLQGIKVDKIIELMGGETWVSCQFHPEYDWRVNTASRAVLERFKTLMRQYKYGSPSGEKKSKICSSRPIMQEEIVEIPAEEGI